MNGLEDNFAGERKEYFNLQKTLLKYWGYRKYFISSGCACLLLAIGYIFIAKPTYQVTASITIHDEERGGSKNEIFSAEKLFYSGRDWLNTENEIEVLKSSSLIEQVVTNLKLYASYYEVGELRNKYWYKSPVTFHMEEKDLYALKSPISVNLTPSSGAITVEISHTMDDGTVWEECKKIAKLPAQLNTPAGTLSIAGNLQMFTQSGKEMEITLNNPIDVAQGYIGQLSVDIVSRTSSVVKIEFDSPDREMGKDFVKELILCYNWNANEDKNMVARRTSDFLDERIKAINDELEATDEQLERFKRTAGLTYVDVDTKEFLQEKSRYDKEMMEIETQLNLLQYLKEYVQKEENKENLIPGDVGLKDASLSKIIDNHNQLVLEYKRLSRTSSESNPTTINLKAQIKGSFQSVVTSLENTYSGTLLTQKEIAYKTNLYNRKINDVPANERMLTEIVRQQETKSSLYLDLLQKKEENALMLEAVTENAKFIDKPYSKQKPSSPNKKVILLVTLVLSGLISFVWIFIKDTFSHRILHPDEVKKRLGNSVFLGEIHRQKEGEKNNKELERLKVRILLALNEVRGKTLCVFSYNEGDGKTYLLSQLSVGFAQTGKRILLLHLSPNPEKETEQGEIRQSPLSDNLYEQTATVSQFSALKEQYKNFDYVLIDSFALKACPEMLMLGKDIDYSVYVCRIEHSERNSLDELEDIQKNALLPNLSLVINGIV